MTTASLFAAAWTAISVSPYPIEKRHPDREPSDARPITAVEAFAAKGEYESAAFQLKSARAMRKVDLRPSALKGPKGATIPADEIDIKVLKYWMRPYNSWASDRVGDLEKLELTPDMLLHDDSLIKVDEKAQVNYVRADYPTGSVYLNMRERGRRSHFNYSLEPVHDAPKFVPLDLEANRYREFFVIFHVPEDVPAGDYTGRLDVVEDGKSAGSLGLKLTVYPFELPRARTHYDTSREYRLMISSNLTLPIFLSGGKDLARAERRLRNSMRECAKHNFLYPYGGDCEVKSVDTDDLAVRTLLIYRACGLPCDPVITGRSYERKWIDKRFGKERATPENDPEGLKESIAKDFLPYIDRQLSAAERFLGHRHWLFMGRDEAGPGTQRLQSGFWRALKDRGAGVYTTTMGPMYRQTSWLTDAADVAARCSQSFSWGWRAGGAKCYTYAGTFCGPECPDLWRRSKGIRFYFADFDGLGDHHFFRDDIGNLWNGLLPTDAGYRRMCSVFPTEDGFIVTTQLEGLREAVDDVRYFSLHRMLAEKAIRSGDTAKRAAGRAEIAWIDSTDPELVYDLDAFRREVAARIVKLQALVGTLPPERLTCGKPLPPCLYGTNPPASADKMELADEFAKRSRYDLAVPQYEAVRLDKAETLKRRFDATIAEAKLLRATKRRDRAVEILDEILPELTKDRDLMRKWALAAKFEAMLTDLIFEERYTEPQLVAAHAVLAEVRKLTPPKVKREVGQYNNCARRLLNCTGFGRHPALLKRYSDELLSDPLTAGSTALLLVETAIGFAESGDTAGALASGLKAETAGADKLDRGTKRKFYLVLGESAAKEGDRATAARAYKALSECYSPEGETAALHRRYLRQSEAYEKPEKSNTER